MTPAPLALLAFKYSAVSHLIGAMWDILVVYWVILAFGNKRTKVRQGRLSRLAYVILLFLPVYFVISAKSLHILLFPINALTQSIGVLICAAGLAFAIWSRHTLGRNWSGFVVIKQDHELIQSGPYEFVRNPLYSGLILGMAGTVLALFPTAEGLILLLVWIIAFYVKSRHEERVLVQEFGEQYAAYKQRVPAALIPFVL